jgi:hypothetical protein
VQIGALLPSGIPREPEGPRAPVRPEFAQKLRAAEGQAVVATRTRLSAAEAGAALEGAWAEKFGAPPPAEAVAILTAQWSHETGGGSSMFNYNFGGIKGTGPSGLHVTQRTREGYGAHEVTIRDRFRAYQTAHEGAVDYVSLLERKYPKALEAAREGDPARFVEELHAGGYFTGEKGAYVRSVSNKAAALLREGIFEPGVERPRAPRLEFSPARPAEGLARVARNPNGAVASPERAQPLGSSAPFTRSLPSASVDLQTFSDHLAIAALRIAQQPDREDA